MRKREGDPFMPPPEYGQSLRSLTVNVLVTDMQRAVVFQRDVLQCEIVYSDPDISIVRGYGTEWMIHADHAYDKHALLPHTQSASKRGAGVEFRLHGCDPDGSAERAQQHDFTVLDGPRDQPDHGLREVHILDQDGYVWVADVRLS